MRRSTFVLVGVVLLILVGWLVRAVQREAQLKKYEVWLQARACMSQMATLTGASEMYCLDNKKSMEDFVKEPDFQALLIPKGYIKMRLHDVGGGEDTWKNYTFDTNKMVRCAKHGRIDDIPRVYPGTLPSP